MATRKLYAIWDNAVGSYDAVHTAISRGMAIRQFIDAGEDEKSALAKHPNDFILFELGDIDMMTGKVSCPLAPQNLGSMASFKAAVQPVSN